MVGDSSDDFRHGRDLDDADVIQRLCDHRSQPSDRSVVDGVDSESNERTKAGDVRQQREEDV